VSANFGRVFSVSPEAASQVLAIYRVGFAFDVFAWDAHATLRTNSGSYMRRLYGYRERVFSPFQKLLHTPARSINTTTCRDSIQDKTMRGDAYGSSRNVNASWFMPSTIRYANQQGDY
jgi:hypothetical protein